jgi:gluconokinase
MNEYPLVWIVTGVAGSGKTVVGRLLSQQLECDFLEGDRRHPLPNIIKMQSHIPLQDSDRQQWLLAMEEDVRRAIALHRETVLTCSALKAAYRKQLMVLGRVQLVWLNVPEAELERRLNQRSNHYMKLEMLRSQIAAFEAIAPEETVITVNGLLSPIEIVNELLQASQQFPDREKPWWHRVGTT